MIISGKPSGEDSGLKVWDGINSLDQVIIDHPNAPIASLWICRRRAQKAIDRASDAGASPDLGTTR